LESPLGATPALLYFSHWQTDLKGRSRSEQSSNRDSPNTPLQPVILRRALCAEGPCVWFFPEREVKKGKQKVHPAQKMTGFRLATGSLAGTHQLSMIQ
ncbi:MAG TPA: hypothetical protein VGR50_03055, partial [Terriglobales bacterium]|nr:hypothetical protein [Terriglobales bacterium]